MNTFQYFFFSEANQVFLRSREGKQYVEKHYSEKLKNYPVNWPLGRAEVEAFLLAFLPERLEGKNISVPTLYDFQKPDILVMEYCAGTPLLEVSTEQLCQESIWKQLFSFLYHLTEISLEEFSQSVKESLGEQQIIFACMKHWKFQDNINPPDNSYGCLVLGDVSLSNVLISPKGLTLLDFECAHWGYYGYDIGQILGMLEVYHHDARLETILAQALEDSVPDSFYRECCFYWKERFIAYYKNKKNNVKKSIEQYNY